VGGGEYREGFSGVMQWGGGSAKRVGVGEFLKAIMVPVADFLPPLPSYIRWLGPQIWAPMTIASSAQRTSATCSTPETRYVHVLYVLMCMHTRVHELVLRLESMTRPNAHTCTNKYARKMTFTVVCANCLLSFQGAGLRCQLSRCSIG